MDGVITDDSDVFLFGAQRVYKNIFGERYPQQWMGMLGYVRGLLSRRLLM